MDPETALTFTHDHFNKVVFCSVQVSISASRSVIAVSPVCYTVDFLIPQILCKPGQRKQSGCMHAY